MRPGDNGWDMARLDDNGGLPLGIVDKVSYEETTITLEPGQTLVVMRVGE